MTRSGWNERGAYTARERAELWGDLTDGDSWLWESRARQVLRKLEEYLGSDYPLWLAVRYPGETQLSWRELHQQLEGAWACRDKLMQTLECVCVGDEPCQVCRAYVEIRTEEM